MKQLHYYPSNASFAPHVLLHELGVPFERVLVDRTQSAHKAPGYLKLNPNGLIPVLEDGDLVLYESAAIAMHLADRFPQARLAPAPGTPARAHYYKWLVWMTNTLQATLIHYFYPDRLVRGLELGESLHLSVLDVSRDELRQDVAAHRADLAGSALHLSLIHISEPTRPY